MYCEKLQQMTSELYQIKADWCVLLWYDYITLYRG